jgi:hypothetical protein
MKRGMIRSFEELWVKIELVIDAVLDYECTFVTVGVYAYAC